MWEKTFTPDYLDPDAAKRAYEAHNAAVRAAIPPDRLIDWQPGDGWEPICAKLGLPVPDAPFPHVNTTEDFQAMIAAGGPPRATSCAPARTEPCRHACASHTRTCRFCDAGRLGDQVVSAQVATGGAARPGVCSLA